MSSIRKGDWMHTHLGGRFYHQDPRPEEVHIEDLAHHLSQLCRFTGATRTMYSVAEHCVRVSYLLYTPYLQLWGLLHDGAESWYNDLNRPLKYSPGMEGYKRYEGLGMDAVCMHFGLGLVEPPEVKAADNRLAHTEKRDLLTNPVLHEGENPLPFPIVPWSSEQAKRIYLFRFYEITGQREFYKSS